MEKYGRIMDKIGSFTLIRALQMSLMKLLPVVMVGAFSLVLESLPIAVYQNFIRSFGGGFFYTIFDTVFLVTFRIMAIVFTFLFSFHLGNVERERDVIEADRVGIMLASIGNFFVFVGVSEDSLEAYGPKGMFIAILATIISTRLYKLMLGLLAKRKFLSEGFDLELVRSLRRILPLGATLLIVALFNYVVTTLTGQATIHGVLVACVTWLFSKIGSSFVASIVFVFVSSILWFCGIHGSDTLEAVSGSVFYRIGDATEETMRVQGALPRNVLDNFVLMGGCGTAVCLLLALLIFSRSRSSKNVIKTAVFPAIFNVSEILVYGVPVVFNLAFLIPFVCAPIVCFLTSYVAIKTGLVPLPVHSAEWTTPILYSGYITTGSIRGALLQLFNLALGVLIYAPFVKLNEQSLRNRAKRTYQTMVSELQNAELDNKQIWLTDSEHSYAWMAKSMAVDLQEALEQDGLELFYQPQYNVDGKPIGAEALFRWRHSLVGMVYPPLAFKLAEECDFLEKLEKWVAKRCFEDVSEFQKDPQMQKLKTSFNVTGTSIQSDSFEKYLLELAGKYNVEDMSIYLEVTEQAALRLDDALYEKFNRLCDKGYRLAVDDFSMGNTSMQYLIGGKFSLIKLDGGIVTQIVDNPRSYDIIVSIVDLAQKMNLDILAEFVCSEEIRDKLEEAGCYMYQGGYFSMAVPKKVYIEHIRFADVKNEQEAL